MDTIRVLLLLSENNDDRVKVDPRIQLASLYREVREMLNTIAAMEKRLEQLEQLDKDLKNELGQLTRNMPDWAAEIELSKERIIRQRGLTLKDMLSIQQEVVKLESDIQAAEGRILELQERGALLSGNRKQILSRLQAIKSKYNQHAEVFNEEKAKADLVMEEIASKEEKLLEELNAEDRMTYKEALRLNPDNPVVILDGDICMGCRIGLSKQIVKQVNQVSKIIHCENCMRIILPADAVDAVSAEEAGA